MKRTALIIVVIAAALTPAFWAAHPMHPAAHPTVTRTGLPHANEDPDFFAPDPAYRSAHPAPYSWAANETMVAHGMGGIADKQVTNSLEAFESSYAKGYRVFEVDLALTSDGKLVARHDWNPGTYAYLGQTAADPNKVLSESEFKALKIHGAYTPLTIDDIVRLMKAHPDIWIITDTKSRKPEEVQAAMKDIVKAVFPDTQLADRFIIQIYDQPMLASVRSVYGFKNIVYTLYQLKRGPIDPELDFAEANGIEVIAMPESSWSPGFTRLIAARGLRSAVYSTNDPVVARCYRESGVSLIYSDFLPPS